jgi:CDGSH-type Zn-finger protein
MEKEQKISIVKNGPYLVTGNIPLIEEIIVFDKEDTPLKWMTVNTFPLKETYSLCRCGKSKNKPFCDGAHVKAKFNGRETANNDDYIKKAQTIEGKDLILTDVRKLCSGVGFCHRAGGTWNLVKNGTTKKEKDLAIKECACCNSGRLVVYDKETNLPIEPKFKPTISITKDGPFWVKGNIPIGKYEIRNRVTLCACGKSENKPFCDGRHYN